MLTGFEPDTDLSFTTGFLVLTTVGEAQDFGALDINRAVRRGRAASVNLAGALTTDSERAPGTRPKTLSAPSSEGFAKGCNPAGFEPSTGRISLVINSRSVCR